MLIDAHCHINSLSPPVQYEVLSESQSRGNYLFVDVSIDTASFEASLNLSRRYSFIYTACGFHPFARDRFSSSLLDTYRSLIRNHPRVVAVGEVGLDYNAGVDAAGQKEALSAFIELAKDFGLPVILHNRWHNDDILDILDEHFADYSKVVFHCFSQDVSFMKKVLDKGGMISFSLNILRKKKNLLDVLHQVGEQDFILETDSPYMKIKGVPSTPLDINRMYQFVSAFKGMDMDELIKNVTCNFRKVFGNHLQGVE